MAPYARATSSIQSDASVINPDDAGVIASTGDDDMNETTYIYWLLLGFLPHQIRRAYLPLGHSTLQIEALYWSLAVDFHPNGRHDWQLHIPLITHLSAATWAALDHLRR
jgi:hypothetical protein